MTELSHSKLHRIYLAELLVVITDRLKIVRIRARNVHHHVYTDTRAYLDDFSHLSLTPGKRRCRVLMRQQWRRNVSQWDGSSRPTFKSGTARNVFCRPTFWPQSHRLHIALMIDVSFIEGDVKIH